MQTSRRNPQREVCENEGVVRFGLRDRLNVHPQWHETVARIKLMVVPDTRVGTAGLKQTGSAANIPAWILRSEGLCLQREHRHPAG